MSIHKERIGSMIPWKSFYITFTYIYMYMYLFLFFVLWYRITKERTGFLVTIVILGTTNGKQGPANEVPVGRGRGRKRT